MDIVSIVSALINDERSNLVNEIVSEFLQYKKFELNIFERIILFIPVDVDNDPVVETLSNSLKKYYVTHNCKWIS